MARSVLASFLKRQKDESTCVAAKSFQVTIKNTARNFSITIYSSRMQLQGITALTIDQT